MKWAWAAALVALVAGCTAAPTWTLVPIEATIDSLANSEAGLIVAGHQGEAPFLAHLSEGGATPVTLAPNEPYAKVATLVSIAAEGERRYALGTAIGGAHANARWTSWSGSASILTNHPQSFFTFGGHDAGPLLGVTVVDGHPMIAGVRTTSTGMRAAIYLEHGTTWTAAPAEAALSSDPQRELSFSGVAPAGDQLLLLGSELLLTPDLPQSPSAWLGHPGHWSQIRLPVPSELTGAGPVWATAATCEPQQCWIAGWAHGRPLAWTLRLTDLRVTNTAILEGSSTDNAAKALITLSDGRPVVATNAATTSIMLGCDAGWRSLSSPGPVQALAGTSAGLYAASNGQVWFLPTPHC